MPYPYPYAVQPVLPSSILGDDFLTLWCFVDGDRAPFSMSAHRGANTAELKQAIKEERKNAYDFDAASLVLWKVRAFHRLT